MLRILAFCFILSVFRLIPALAEGPAIQLQDGKLETPKHTFVLGPSGLPQQIGIKADSSELPLELRGKKAELTESLLQWIGRGDQLRQPVRFVARIAGQEIVAEATKPGEPQIQGSRALIETDLKAGDVSLSLRSAYHSSGRMDFAVSFGSNGKEIESLSLVFDLAGRVDTVVPGNPVAETLRTYSSAEFAVGSEEGVVWANTGPSVREGGRNSPGLLPRVFVGSGDRGFTWLAPKADGFLIDEKAESMVLERDKAGQITWRIHLVNHAAKLDAQRTASFSVLIHPVCAKANNLRAKTWLEELGNLPRSDQVLDFDEGAPIVSLEGPAGGDALSADQPIATTYPIILHRYLAGTHTGLGARLTTNAVKLTKPGRFLGLDRMALGRALLHDVGLDSASLAHLAEAATVVKALEEFGCFKEDGQTEFIPYWRTGAVVRIGEEFAAADAFALTAENPLADVHLSLWRRPNGKSAKALIVIVNESPKPVREQLYVLDPVRLFGGPNDIHGKDIIQGWDMAAIPAESDWSKDKLKRQVTSHGGDKDPDISLLDMTDKGFVRVAAIKKDLEIYGLVHLPPYSYRILYGAGR